MLTTLRRGNLLLAFLIELSMLAGLCFAGWSVAGPIGLRVLLSVGLPGLAIWAWAAYAAPRAGKSRLRMPRLMWFKVAMFSLATAAWWVTGQAFIGSIFAALAVINVLGMMAFRQH